MKTVANVVIAGMEGTPLKACEAAARLAAPEVVIHHVQDAAGFDAVLAKVSPDIAIARWGAAPFGATEAAAALHARDPDAAVLAVVQSVDPAVVAEMRAGGVFDFVQENELSRLAFSLPRALDEVVARRKLRHDEAAGAVRVALAEAAQRVASEGILAVDRRGHAIFANPRFLSLWRLDADAVDGAACRALIDAIKDKIVDRDAVLSRLRGICRGGDAQDEVTLKDGTTLAVSSLVIERDDAASEPVGRLWIFRETMAKGAKDVLAHEEGIAEALTEQDIVGTLVYDVDGTILEINPHFANKMGYSLREVRGQNFSQFIVPEVREATIRSFQRVARGHTRSAQVNTQIVAKDGRRVDILGQWMATNRGGKPVIIGVALDVSAFNQTRAALAASEDLYRTVVSVMAEGVFIVDADGRVVTCNDAAAQTLGYTQDEILKRNSYDPSWNMVHEDGTLLKGEEHPSAIALRTGKPIRDITVGVRHRDGRLRWINANAQPIFDKGESKPRAAVVSFADVTGHKNDQDNLTRLNHALTMLSRANEVVVRAPDEQDLLNEICRVLTDEGGYALAWIGLQITQPVPRIRPVSVAGGGATLTGQALGPHGSNALCDHVDAVAVLKSGKPHVVTDLAAEEPSGKVGSVVPASGSRIVLPLHDRATPLGVLVLYAAKPDAFVAEEMHLLVQLADNLAFGIGSLRERGKIEDSETHLRRAMEAAVQAIASTLEMRDPYTAGHQRDVARLAVAIAREVGVPEEEIEGIYLAAIVHDIGKIRIPIDILSKPGPLTHLEYELIQTHAQIGYDIMKHVDFPWPVAQMILQHHERLDGSGYPAGLKGDAILNGAKIIAVADVVQAMSMRRPYRGAFGEAAALDEIERGRGRLYDPAAVDACLKLFHEKGFKFA